MSRFLSTKELPLALNPQDSLPTVIERLGNAAYTVLPVVDSNKRLLGIVTLEEVYLASHSPEMAKLVLAEDLMRSDIEPLTPLDTLDRALELFVENDLLTLPVVASLVDRLVVGTVSRFDISSEYLRHVHGPAEGLEEEVAKRQTT